MCNITLKSLISCSTNVSNDNEDIHMLHFCDTIFTPVKHSARGSVPPVARLLVRTQHDYHAG